MALATPAVHQGIERFIVLDTETTGLNHAKIITLAAISFENDRIIQRTKYLIFDPRRDSEPKALEVHGWDNWTTRFQDLFVEHASELHEWLSWGDKLVMHNAEFDHHYVQREFRKANLPPLEVPTHCTLQQARSHWPGQRCGLDECSDRIGVSRRGGNHNALQDALITAAVFLAMKGKSMRVPERDVWPMPQNFREPDARPEGALPRRTAKRATT